MNKGKLKDRLEMIEDRLAYQSDKLDMIITFLELHKHKRLNGKSYLIKEDVLGDW